MSENVGKDGRSPSGPGSRPSDGAASSGVSTVPASIPNAERLYALPRSTWNALTNRGYLELPKAKRASEPFVYRGGEPPVPNGAKISTWYPNEGRPLAGWWVPTTAKPSIWERPPVVFRLRDGDQFSHCAAPDTFTRIANALERIAQAMEEAS